MSFAPPLRRARLGVLLAWLPVAAAHADFVTDFAVFELAPGQEQVLELPMAISAVRVVNAGVATGSFVPRLVPASAAFCERARRQRLRLSDPDRLRASAPRSRSGLRAETPDAPPAGQRIKPRSPARPTPSVLPRPALERSPSAGAFAGQREKPRKPAVA